MTSPSPTGAHDLRVGSYARVDVEVSSVAGADEPLELSLAAPFGALFATLFSTRPFRVKSLSLEYVAPERLGALATFSARLSELRDGGECARLSLLVFRESNVCVRGEASVVLGALPPSAAPSASGKAGSGRANGEIR